MIRLRFVEHFHIESENDQCTYDYLEIRDGMFGYSAEIHKLCGTSPPTVVESRGRHLWLRFHSDQDIRYKGFKAMYEFVPRYKSLISHSHPSPSMSFRLTYCFSE